MERPFGLDLSDDILFFLSGSVTGTSSDEATERIQMAEHCPGSALSDTNAISLLSEDHRGSSPLKTPDVNFRAECFFPIWQSRVKKFHVHLVLMQGAKNRLHTSRMVPVEQLQDTVDQPRLLG